MDRRRRKNDKPYIRPSDKVKRCLFGKADEAEKEEENRRYFEESLSHLEKMKLKYGYDFVQEKHVQLKNTPFTVAKIIKPSDEQDLTPQSSPTSVVNVVTSLSSETTLCKHCINEDETKLSNNGKTVNVITNGRTQTGERIYSFEIDKTSVESDRQS